MAGRGTGGRRPESGDRFGSSLAAADIDCDGYTDLGRRHPTSEDINGQSDSGYAQVIWGASTGLGTDEASTQYTQTNFAEPIVAGDQFGYSVDAVEDLAQGGTPAADAYALAFGVPGPMRRGQRRRSAGDRDRSGRRERQQLDHPGHRRWWPVLPKRAIGSAPR